MEFVQVDVFADAPYEGNPLAVFHDASELSRSQMQKIAAEMSLSETTFVTDARADSYDVRIFTPTEELGFAGHPTVGTAWALRHLGACKADELLQRSPGGLTRVWNQDDGVWFVRPGRAEDDLESNDPRAAESMARALSIDPSEIGLEARELGRSGRLRPAFSDAGLRQLIVPIRDVASLGRISPQPALLSALADTGAYCVTAWQAGRVRARGFFPRVGIAEDPGTGSAAAALGLYLADRIGAIEFEIVQGVEMGRRSRILVRAEPGEVRVGGRCHLSLSGRLDAAL